MRARHLQSPNRGRGDGKDTQVAKHVDYADAQVELCFINWTIAGASFVELRPVVRKRFAVEREDDVVRDKVAGGDKDTAPCQPRHAEDTTVKEEDGSLDHSDTPCVDVHVGEGYLEHY